MTIYNNNEILSKINKFGRESLRGFLCINIIALGRRLGIFNYLYKKLQYQVDNHKIDFISFTFKELMNNLNLDKRYLDAWLNAAIEIGLFKNDVNNLHVFKTEPYIFDFLINEKSPFYFGDLFGSVIRMAINHEKLLRNFKTGEILERDAIPEDIIMDGHRTTARMGRKLMNYYIKYFPDHHKETIQGGSILELGCGYGFNLINWANKYNKSQILGIDIDERAISFTKKNILESELDNRVKVLNKSLNQFYQQGNDFQFNLIILNQVFHEIEMDDTFRVNFMNQIYSLLDINGLVLIGESIVSDIFTSNRNPQLIEAFHKWQEVCVPSKFYNETDFRKFINLTKFKLVDLIEENDFYFWVLKK